MKIIQVIDKLGATGGVNSFVYDLCKAQADMGNDVTIIGLLKSSNIGEQGKLLKNVKIVSLEANDKISCLLFYLPKLREKIKEISDHENTVCNLHLKLSVLMGTIATIGLKNVRCVETYHNTYHHYHLQFYVLHFLVKKYITVSLTAQKELYEKFKAPKEKVIAIPNGVDRNELRRLAGFFQKRRDEINIVSVGRFSYEKNFIIPVKGLQGMCDERFYYTLIGNGPEFGAIQEEAKNNRRIKLLGELPRKEVLHILGESDIVIMPSLWEGRSILQLEAMAFDLPMVLSDVQGLREPFGEKPLGKGEEWRRCKFGYLVETNNPLAYFKAIKDFLNNPQLHSSMSYEVKKASYKNDINHVAKRYIEVYKEVLAKEKTM